MVGRDITPTEIGKHSNLIKVAQEEMGTMDVLVCGRCLTVYHFIEEFKQHKQSICQKEDISVRECNDTKPKIWAFLLWKATQLNNNKETNTANPTSWALYQTWVKMEEGLRETWVVAGKTIQSFAKVGQGGLQEMPVKITKTVVNNNAEAATPGRKPLTQSKPQVANLKPPAKLPVANKESDNETSPLKSSPPQIVIKKTLPTISAANQSKVGAITTSSSKPLSRTAKRSVPNSTEITEETVEKIVAKRFNPRRKMHEYLVKWELRSHDQNTWEPALHLDNVPHLLDTFEKQLARQKETRAALQAKENAAAHAVVNRTGDKITDAAKSLATSSPSSGEFSIGRPTRTSKTKAMDQVKQWVTGSGAASPSSAASDAAGTPGNDNERDWSVNTSSSAGGLHGAKRKLDDSDFNDSTNSELPTTTATMEDLEDDLIPSHTVKRVKNGNAVSVESKTVRVNGSASRGSSVSGESLAVGPHSAEVIITQDSSASGVVKKPGFNSSGTLSSRKNEAQVRVLSKGESAVTSTGIVRLNVASTDNNHQSDAKTHVTRNQPVRVGGGKQSTPITSISQRQHLQRAPGGTIIQRKPLPTALAAQQQRTPTVQQKQVSPASGRMIIPRQGTSATTRTPVASNKNVTPEQKILQLSKSGDLKVTKKVMTREDANAQRMPQHQRQQHLLRQQQQQQQQQQQVQIQTVQQITPPVGRSTSYKSEETQLCPITGKILGPDGQPVPVQSAVMQTQIVTDAHQELDTQQQLQDIDPTLLLASDHQMLTNEDGSPLLVTGEDGTVYQVAGKNAEGQTILVTQGPDGEQQFAYVAAADGEDQSQVLTLDNAVAEAVAQLPSEQAEALAAAAGNGGSQYLVKTTQEDGTTQVVTMSEAELQQHQALAQHQQIQASANTGTTSMGQLCIQTGEGADGQDSNIPAEVVQADLPSPGGTRRVVLLLQDGTFMMTEMHEDEYKALNIAS